MKIKNEEKSARERPNGTDVHISAWAKERKATIADTTIHTSNENKCLYKCCSAAVQGRTFVAITAAAAAANIVSLHRIAR